jgi:hypothetical protein
MRKAPVALVSAVIAIAGVVVAFGVLRDDGASETAALPTRVAATMIPVTLPPATTPRPEDTEVPSPSLVSPDFPIVKWTRVEPAEINERNWMATGLVLDTMTGEIFSPIERALVGIVGSGMSWRPDGQVLLNMFEFGGELRQKAFTGYLLGPLYEVSGWRISSKGWIAAEDGLDNVLLDTKGNKVQLLPPRPWRLGSFSPDGRYFSLEKSEIGVIPGSAIWDSETRQTVIEVPGVNVRWSNNSKFFLYTPAALQGRDIGHLGLRLVDVASSEERVIPDALAGWPSPDARYLVVDGTADAPTSYYDFRIFDLVQDRYILTLRGAWPDAWFDGNTLGFTGNVCDTYDYFTIDVDGDRIGQFSLPGRRGVAQPSPQHDKFAYGVADYGGTVQVRVTSVMTSQVRDYDVGAATRIGGWSPDGRYLFVSIPPGKGGLCEFEQPRTLAVEAH